MKEEMKLSWNAGRSARPSIQRQCSGSASRTQNQSVQFTRATSYDGTIEKIQDLLVDNPGGCSIFRAELAGFFTTLDTKDTRRTELSVEGANGDRQLHRRSHHTRNRLHAVRSCLIGGIQPDTLAGYLADAVHGGKGNDYVWLNVFNCSFIQMPCGTTNMSTGHPMNKRWRRSKRSSVGCHVWTESIRACTASRRRPSRCSLRSSRKMSAGRVGRVAECA